MRAWKKVKQLGDLEGFMPLISVKNHDAQRGFGRAHLDFDYNARDQKYTHFVLPEASTAGKGTQPDSTFKKGLNFS